MGDIRCGLCAYDLSITINEYRTIFIIMVSDPIAITWGVGTLLDELITMGYGDTYE